MSKVKINTDKLRVAENMRPAEEQGTVIYTKITSPTKPDEIPAEQNKETKKDAAAN